jgi:hypothetical protein
MIVASPLIVTPLRGFTDRRTAYTPGARQKLCPAGAAFTTFARFA